MANTYELIKGETLTATVATYSFTAIPATFTDLKLVVSLRSDVASIGGSCRVRVNGSTSTYSGLEIYGDGSNAGSQFNSTSFWNISDTVNGNTSTSNTFTSGEMYFPNYAGSANKTSSVFGATESNTTTAIIAAIANLWANNAAITQIDLINPTGNWMVNSSFYLYGIKNS